MSACTFASPMSAEVEIALAALAFTALWVGFGLGEIVGYRRGARRTRTP